MGAILLVFFLGYALALERDIDCLLPPLYVDKIGKDRHFFCGHFSAIRIQIILTKVTTKATIPAEL